MTSAIILYPHQLWKNISFKKEKIYLVEDPLFFRQYNFHAQKLMLHRASMKCFAEKISKAGTTLAYINCSELSDSSSIGEIVAKDGIKKVYIYEFDDDWLTQRVVKGLQRNGIALEVLPSLGFMTSLSESREFFSSQKRNFFTDFYVWQRKRLDILLEKGNPVGGKWSFDHDNRKKLPRDLPIPNIPVSTENKFSKEAREYVAAEFPKAFGNSKPLLYPHSHEEAERWLNDFIENRLSQFGDFEDAISKSHRVIFHSMLTPMLNIGLLTPDQIVKKVLKCKDIPLNSLEGFIRQVVGWREYMRAMYMMQGSKIRNSNFFKCSSTIPKSFYDGTTGIDPVDEVIHRLLETGYCHHIERLMVLGNFMLLCEINPDAVYQWFMELFIDSYDWVMVPNVYAMSQYADGGTMTTKPYISGSSYILKMSDHSKGSWCKIWDALYWNHISKHKKFYASNHRMSVMAAMCDKLGEKLALHEDTAQEFLCSLRKGLPPQAESC